MATNFKNKVSNNVGTTPVTLVTAGPAMRITVVGLSLANVTEGTVVASVKVTDSDANEGYYVKEVPIPAHTSLRVVNGGERLVLAADCAISVEANVSDAFDVVMSYVEIV